MSVTWIGRKITHSCSTNQTRMDTRIDGDTKGFRIIILDIMVRGERGMEKYAMP